MSLKLVSDNSNRYWDSAIEQYTDNPEPPIYPYMVNDHDDEVTAFFKTWADACAYQLGMGIRATSDIEMIL